MTGNFAIHIFILLLCTGFLSPVHSQWVEKSSMPVARSGVSAVNLDDKIYLIGGKNLNVYFDRVDIYDPQTNSWDTTSAVNLGYARSDAACVAHNGRIFLIGGRNQKGALKQVEVFDPDSNRWQLVDELKGPRDGALAQVLNDTLLVIGGVDNEGAYIEKIEYYDDINDSWKNANIKLSPPRAGGLSAVQKDTIWIFGGFYFSPLSSSLKFSTAKIWSPGPDLALARGEGAAVVIGDSIMLIGGEAASGTVALVEIYNIQSGIIEPGLSLPEPRAGHTAVTHEDKIYVFGGHGENPGNVFNSVLCYDAKATGITNRITPEQYLLLESYPNPFNSETRIRFSIPESVPINLSVFDVQGRKISTLIDGRINPGTHQTSWNGLSDGNSPIASGVYFLRLSTENRIITRKLVCIR